MKSLVLWCRWHDARLRLHGRDEAAVWGELVFGDDKQSFRFDLNTRQLVIEEEEGTRRLQLDEMGVEVG